MKIGKIIKRSFKVDEVLGVEIPVWFMVDLSTVHYPKLMDKI